MPNLLRSIKLSATLTALFLSLAGFLFYQTYLHYQNFSNLIHHPHIAYRPSKSVNWAGYATATNLAKPQAGSVSDVRASWIIPNLTCDQRSTYSAIWVGIDGYRSSTVEQIGTESDCSHGQPKHSAWFEIFPHTVQSLDLPDSRSPSKTALLTSKPPRLSALNAALPNGSSKPPRFISLYFLWPISAQPTLSTLLPPSTATPTHQVITPGSPIGSPWSIPSAPSKLSPALSIHTTRSALPGIIVN